MLLRYDDYEPDAVLEADIVRADKDGEPISPPLLSLRDHCSGDVIHLTREQAWKLRTLIGKM